MAGMWSYIRDWYRRHFSEPQVVILTLTMLLSAVIIFLLVRTLPAVLASVIIAYLLEGQVRRLEDRGLARRWGATAVVLGFCAMLFALFFGLLPLLSRQLAQLFGELPVLAGHLQRGLLRLAEAYPGFFDEAQVAEVSTSIRRELGRFGQQAIGLSLGLIPNLITLLVYAVLMPIMIFFFLRDKHLVMNWVRGFLPARRSLLESVWAEVDEQLGNYVRGKFWEILIVSSVTIGTFLAMGLNYAVLLGALVGVSVVIPFVGATIMTIPVFVVAFLQWGMGPHLAWTMVAYFIIQALDGNVLVPLLFSEVVNLHPVAIIIAVLFFGSVWGVWGVFFAIPLATVIKALLRAWSVKVGEESQTGLRPPDIAAATANDSGSAGPAD